MLSAADCPETLFVPRLRSLPAGFTLRNRGFRSPEKSLAESSASGKLLAEYELAAVSGSTLKAPLPSSPTALLSKVG